MKTRAVLGLSLTVPITLKWDMMSWVIVRSQEAFSASIMYKLHNFLWSCPIVISSIFHRLARNSV